MQDCFCETHYYLLSVNIEFRGGYWLVPRGIFPKKYIFFSIFKKCCLSHSKGKDHFFPILTFFFALMLINLYAKKNINFPGPENATKPYLAKAPSVEIKITCSQRRASLINYLLFFFVHSECSCNVNCMHDVCECQESPRL